MNVNVVGRSQGSRHAMAAALGVLILVGATGCKTGTVGMKPSWWTFGGGPQEDASKLAAAPSFNGGTEKPSAAAKPYPTTTTPNGYVLGGAAPSGVVAGESVAAVAPVTYGVTPPPAKPEPVAVATAPASAPASTQTGGSLASISPQVGPYAALPSDPTAAQNNLPPLQPIAATAPAVPGSSGYGTPPSAPATPSDTQRVADARGAAGWPAQQSAPASTTAGSRYESATGSRFGGGSAIDQPLPPPAAAMPAVLEPLPAAPPSAAAPLASPSQSAPMTGFQPPPAAAPPSVPPSAPPARRPDPGYRPGGTSSYRPNRAILATDPLEAEPGDVRTVGFEAPAAAGP